LLRFGDLFFAILSYSMFVRKIIFRAEQSTIERAREVAQSEGRTLEDAFRERPVLRQLATRRMINSDLTAVLRPHVQALGGQLSYNDRHMVLPFETSYRLDMG